MRDPQKVEMPVESDCDDIMSIDLNNVEEVEDAAEPKSDLTDDEDIIKDDGSMEDEDWDKDGTNE